MTEKGPINNRLTKHEACDDSLGRKKSLRLVQLTEGISLRQTVEICADCGVEKEQTSEQLKWVWHGEQCQNPGDLTVLQSLHGFLGSGVKEHFDVVDVKCEGCQQSVQIKTDLRECWCLEPQF